MAQTHRKSTALAPLRLAARHLRDDALAIGRRIRHRLVDRLSLRAKLVGIAALGILFVVAVALVALSGLRALGATEAQSRLIGTAQRTHAEALLQLGTLRTAVQDVRARGDAAGSGRVTVEHDAAAVQSLLRELVSLDFDRPALVHGIARFAQEATAAVEAARQIAAGDGPSPATLALVLRGTSESSATLSSALDQAMRSTSARAGAARATVRLRIVLAAGLALLVLLAASHLLSMSIIRALQRIGEAAQAVAGGHLAARAHVTSSDEIGRVGRAFDDVADSLTSLLIQMESDAKRVDFGRQLGEAMEMVDAEEDVRRVVAQAFALIAPEAPMELLLADSSQAHLERAAESPTAGGAGCTVVSPYSCLAVRKGVATSFETGEALNACHKLRGRPSGACSAVCVPISFMGRSMGVLHATGPAGDPPALEVQRQLVTLARHTGMRIGTVRAFARTELQASTDGLTGLLNRRTLENRIRELLKARSRFALAMIDLDRFKQLNDTFGHEAGDRALRLFAAVVREGLRTDDVCGRMGGEEFVLVLPENDVESALPVLERLREHLAATVQATAGPAFTASFGIADSSAGHTLEDLLRIADAGLLRAKAEGRDRVVVGTAADAAALIAKAA